MQETKSRLMLVIGRVIVFYDLRYSKRRKKYTISMSIDVLGQLKVSAHPSMKQEQIERLLVQHLDWIIKRTQEKRALLSTKQPLNYQVGTNFYYLGKPYSLQILDIPREFGVQIQENYLCVSAYYQGQQLIKKIDRWYKNQAILYFRQRLEQLVLITPWVKVIPELKIRNMQRQWGNCSARGKVTLNTHLIKLPVHLIDYVILHELCHLQEHNHSRRFYQLLQSVEYKHAVFRKEIKQYVYHLYGLTEKN